MLASRLRMIVEKHGAASIGGIGSTRTTNEEAYLFQKLLREVIGTPNVDHHHGNFPGSRDPLTDRPWMMTNSIAEIEKEDVVEVPCLVERDTITPEPCGELPEAVRGLVLAVKAYERAAIEAALSGSELLARKAMLLYPAIGEWEPSKELLEQLIIHC